MATTSITITKKAYDYLKSIKGRRSFSETILGLSRGREDVMRFAGCLRDADMKDIENARKSINRDWRHRR